MRQVSRLGKVLAVRGQTLWHLSNLGAEA